MHSDLRAYLNGLGVRTLLLIPLFSQGQINGILSFRFAEKRDFQAEELEIARAQPMSIKDSSLLESMRILAERSNIPGRLCCTFRSNLVDDEGLPVVVRQRWLLVVGSWRLAVGSLRLVVGGWPFNDSWSRREVVSRRDE
jgi:hypothetical protein